MDKIYHYMKASHLRRLLKLCDEDASIVHLRFISPLGTGIPYAVTIELTLQDITDDEWLNFVTKVEKLGE